MGGVECREHTERDMEREGTGRERRRGERPQVRKSQERWRVNKERGQVPRFFVLS